MANTYEDDKKILDTLLADWSKDSVLDRTNPKESLAKNMEHHSKYLKILSTNALNVKSAETDYRNMRRKRLSYYEGSLTQGELISLGWSQYLGKSPKTSTQREELLENDEFLIEIEKRQKVYEIIVDNCDRIIKEINSRHYSIKAYMEWELRVINA